MAKLKEVPVGCPDWLAFHLNVANRFKEEEHPIAQGNPIDCLEQLGLFSIVS